MVGRTKWIFYQNHAKAVTRATTVNKKNLTVVTRFGGSLEEPRWDSRIVGRVSRGNEGFKVEGEACKPLLLLDGRVRQLEDGACVYEGQTSNLLEEEKEELR